MHLKVHFGSLKGSRTPHSAVKGRRLNRLTMRPYRQSKLYILKVRLSSIFEKLLNFILFFVDISCKATDINIV